jgi:hypothetical protein
MAVPASTILMFKLRAITSVSPIGTNSASPSEKRLRVKM